MKKRTLGIIGGFALVVLSLLFAFTGPGTKPGSGGRGTLVVTQDGRYTLVAQPDGSAVPQVIYNNPKPRTNAPRP